MDDHTHNFIVLFSATFAKKCEVSWHSLYLQLNKRLLKKPNTLLRLAFEDTH